MRQLATFFVALIISATAFTQDKFMETGNMNYPHATHSATLLKDGRVLIAGGEIAPAPSCVQGSSVAEIYDPQTGHFTLTGSLNMNRVTQSAVLLDDGRVWLVGDYTGCSPTNTTEFLRPDHWII